MDHAPLVDRLLAAVDRRVPALAAVPENHAINAGNAAVCLIDGDGRMWGRIYGGDRIRGRASYDLAFRKASQVWITGYPTGTYEELVYAKRVEWWRFGILKPDFVGWEGGQPVALGAGTVLSAGFSGFRGEDDLAIVSAAVAEVLAGAGQ